MRRFGEKLRILRAHNHMTLKELALALGLSAHGYISEIESGKKKPTVDFVLNVAKLFNLTTDQLLKDELEIDTSNPEKDKRELRMNMSSIASEPTTQEVEKLRLILSTYQDGSGQQQGKKGGTLPGWRDFERSVALTFGGSAQESKFIFDVLLADPNRPGIFIGISCKMRRTLRDTQKSGRVTLELSNSAGMFWKELNILGINQQNYQRDPRRVGESLISLVNMWHSQVSIENGGTVDIQNSYYFALSWDEKGNYQLFKFVLLLPSPQDIEWDFPTVLDQNGKEKPGRRLRGRDRFGIIFEWYGESGGQLKYYPKIEHALWKSDIFQLEPLPQDWISRHGILVKAQDYFPEPWSKLTDQSR